MTYFDIVNQAINTVVVTDATTNVTYLEPLYKEILKVSEIEFDENILPMDELYEILKLEVQKRNAMNNPVNELTRKINSFINENIDPVLEDNNQKLMFELLEYMKEKDKKAEEESEAKRTGIGIVNFAKKNN